MKVPFSASDAATWTGGSVIGGAGDRCLLGVSIDSRTIARGELFVAIQGPTHDGHRFLEVAVARAAAGLLVVRGSDLPALLAPSLSVIAVDDTTRALGALAAGHRADFDGPVVAITGSNGKTTTKEMCAAVLSAVGPCHRTPGNLNNQYGLPLTLLGRDRDDRCLVVELGMNHRGEIEALAALARPTVGVITNVGIAHIEHLGSRAEIAAEKGDLVAMLPRDATAVLNADDALVARQAARTQARVVTFGVEAAADVRAERVERLGADGYAFELVAPEGRVAVRVRGLGATTVPNALAACAAGLAAGAALEQVAEGIARHEPVKGRLEARALANGALLVDDSYNANPQSVEAALRLLSQLRDGRRAVAVLGDMGELGDASESAHRGAGRLAAELDVDFVVTLGDRAECVASGAVEAGMKREHAIVARDHGDAAARASALLREGDVVLVKGSRAMQMERVARAIEKAAADNGGAPRGGEEGA